MLKVKNRKTLMEKVVKNGLPISQNHFPFLPSYSLYFLSKKLPFANLYFQVGGGGGGEGTTIYFSA